MIITLGEVHEGLIEGPKALDHADGFGKFIKFVRVIPLNRSIMRRFAMLQRGLRTTGRMIPDFDLLIAATAVEYDLILVTRNIRHFEHVPGIRLHIE